MPKQRKADSQRITSNIYLMGYVESINGTAHTRIRGMRQTTGLRFDLTHEARLREILDQRIAAVINPDDVVAAPTSPSVQQQKVRTLHDAIHAYMDTTAYTDAIGTVKNFYKKAWMIYLPSDLPLNHGEIYLTIDKQKRSREALAAAPETTRKRLQYLKKFFNWCVRMEYLSRNPFDMIDVPVYQSKPIVPYSQDEANAIIEHLRAFPSTSLFSLFTRLLDRSGMRPGECLELLRSSVQGSILVINGKGGQRREFPIDDPLFAEVGVLVREIMSMSLHPTRLWPWNNYTKIGDAVREAKVELGIIDTVCDDQGKIVVRNLHAFRKTAINRWEKSYGLSSAVRAALAGHDENIQKAHYLTKMTAVDITNSIDRDLQRTAV